MGNIKSTPEMEAYFIANAMLESQKKMASKFGVSENVVHRIFKQNNIVVPKRTQLMFAGNALKGRTNFTEEEDTFIKENYLEIPMKTMAKMINRSHTGIQGRLTAFGLVIPEAIRESRKKEGMFRKGQVPINKGKKQTEFMTAEGIERSKATRFHKGQDSHNALPEGSEVVRIDKRKNISYLMIKPPGYKKLVYKHIHVWETKNNKKLPKGHNIVFKDGDSFNCEPDNLECISDAELMKRNSHQNLPPELKELIPIKAAIIRQINKHKKQQDDSRIRN